MSAAIPRMTTSKNGSSAANAEYLELVMSFLLDTIGDELGAHLVRFTNIDDHVSPGGNVRSIPLSWKGWVKVTVMRVSRFMGFSFMFQGRTRSPALPAAALAPRAATRLPRHRAA